MPPRKFPATPLTRRGEGPRGHAFIPPAPSGRPQQLAVMEWELRGESWTDEHPHDELNYVIQGHLFVLCDGETTEVRTGDLVLVPAGAVSTYWAPEYARMLAVYGPDPQGRPSRIHGYERILPRPDNPCPS